MEPVTPYDVVTVERKAAVVKVIKVIKVIKRRQSRRADL